MYYCMVRSSAAANELYLGMAERQRLNALYYEEHRMRLGSQDFARMGRHSTQYSVEGDCKNAPAGRSLLLLDTGGNDCWQAGHKTVLQ